MRTTTATLPTNTRNWRLGQFWDWGQNCKVHGYPQETTQMVAETWRENGTQEEWDRFWEGYNAPKSRATLVSIKV